MEPDFISQTAEPMSKVERRKWAIERAAEFFNQGATHYRLTSHETIPNLLLLEGWKVRPEDEGEPHFQFAAR
jgi:hypothetical protein